MAADSGLSAEVPVVAEGPFSRTSLATIAEVRRHKIDRAVVLTGPGNSRIVRPEDPIDLISLLTAGFRHYYVVDTTAKQAKRKENRRMATDPRYTFDLTIDMAARVSDPMAFIEDFGSKASIFDAFYADLMEDITAQLGDCQPDDMREAQSHITAYATTIKKNQPYHRGVQILQFNVRLEYGPELAKEIQILDNLSKDERFGEKYFIVQSAVDPSRATANDKMRQQMRESQTFQREARHAEFEKGLSAIERLSQVTGEDISKLVKKSDIMETLPHLIEKPVLKERPTSVRLADLRSSVRAAPNGIGRDVDQDTAKKNNS